MLVILAALAVTACQSAKPLIDGLDAQSGLTVVADDSPAVFARTLGQFSRSARDYVYLGPVDINERGVHEYYLWVGMASTIDRDFLAAELQVPTVLILEIDGVPMEFELKSRDERLPRLAGRSLYAPAVLPWQELAARVTLNQLALMLNAKIDSVRVGTDAGSTIEYVRWDDSPTWSTFAEHARLR
jgi:hypothetical protein